MAKQSFSVGQVLTAAQMQSLQSTAMGGGSPSVKTASYVLVAADAGTVIQVNSTSATTITVNTGLFSAGDSVQIQNINTGVVTITAGTATVTTSGSLALSQWEGGFLYFTSASASIFFDFTQAGTTLPLTTKGDLFGYDTGNARVPIGTNGQVLTADSAQALGLKWANASSADSVLTAEQSQYYIQNFRGSETDLVATQNTTWYVPIYLPTCSIDRIAVVSGSSFTSAGNTRLGLYNASTTTGKPTTLVFDAGTVNVDANVTQYAITISQSINAGWYYFAVNRQGGTYNIYGVVSVNFFNTVSSTLLGNQLRGYSETGITGAFPASAGTLVVNTIRNPIAGVRIV